MKMFTDTKKRNCVDAFFAVKELMIPAIISAVVIMEAAE